MYRGVLWSAGSVVAAILAFFVYTIVDQSIPGWQATGWTFFTDTNWTFSSGGYSVWPLLLGTAFSTLGAILIATPIAIGSAFAIVFLIPHRIKIVVSAAVELLAVVPSIIFGIWGAVTLSSWFGLTFQPWLQSLAHGHWPFNGVALGYGLMLGSTVLAVMILPTITSISRDVISLVPRELIEGAMSLGATRSQVLRKVVLRTARTGIVGGVVLGVGRALGETVAMAFLLGGVTNGCSLPVHLFCTGGTVATEIVSNYPESFGQPSAIGVLSELALVLMVVVGAVNLIARLIVKRAERRLR